MRRRVCLARRARGAVPAREPAASERCRERGLTGVPAGSAYFRSLSTRSRYNRFLEWDIVERPRSTRIADRVLSPVLGKSVVLYARKQAVEAPISTMPAPTEVAA